MWRPSQWLTGWDASTWAVTSSDLNFGSAVVGVIELEGNAIFDSVAEQLQRLSDEYVLLRERVAQTGIPLLPGRVEATARCDVLDHLSHTRLAEQPKWGDLRPIVEKQLDTNFAADRPAWRAVLVTGSNSSAHPSRSFLVIALHHALIDGNGAIRLAEALIHDSDDEPLDKRSDLESNDLAGALIDMASHAGAKLFSEGTTLLAQVMADPNSAAEHLRQLVRSGLRTVNPFARPLSSLLAPRSGELATTRLQADVDSLLKVSKDNSVTLTSVLLCGVAIGLSAYHQRFGDMSRQVRVNVPIALPVSAKQRNSLSVTRVVLDLSPLDTKLRLKQINEQLVTAKSEPALQWTSVAADLSRLLPLETFASLIGGADLTVSSMKGPRAGGVVAGLPVIGLTPFAPVFGAAFSMNFVTFEDQIFAGICADRAAVSDMKRFRRDCLRGLAEITALAQ